LVRSYGEGGGVFPVDDVFDVGLGDVVAVAVPDGAFEQHFDCDGEGGDSRVVEFVEVVVGVGFAFDLQLGEAGAVGVAGLHILDTKLIEHVPLLIWTLFYSCQYFIFISRLARSISMDKPDKRIE
jgi:hypothetical protein